MFAKVGQPAVFAKAGIIRPQDQKIAAFGSSYTEIRIPR
jgi:hypothetical protein